MIWTCSNYFVWTVTTRLNYNLVFFYYYFPKKREAVYEALSEIAATGEATGRLLHRAPEHSQRPSSALTRISTPKNAQNREPRVRLKPSPPPPPRQRHGSPRTFAARAAGFLPRHRAAAATWAVPPPRPFPYASTSHRARYKKSAQTPFPFFIDCFFLVHSRHKQIGHRRGWEESLGWPDEMAEEKSTMQSMREWVVDYKLRAVGALPLPRLSYLASHRFLIHVWWEIDVRSDDSFFDCAYRDAVADWGGELDRVQLVEARHEDQRQDHPRQVRSCPRTCKLAAVNSRVVDFVPRARSNWWIGILI